MAASLPLGPARAAPLNINLLLVLVVTILALLPSIASAEVAGQPTTCRMWSLRCIGGRDMGACKHENGIQHYVLSARCLWGDCYMNTEQDSAECPSPEAAASAAAAAAKATPVSEPVGP